MAILMWILIMALLVVALVWLCKTLCKRSPILQYYLKNAFFYTTVVVAATLSCIYGWYRPKHHSNLRPIMWTIIKTRWLLGLKLETRNGQHLESNQPFVLVANHQSGLDMLCMSWVGPPGIVCLIKRELMYMLQFGLSAWLCGSIFIDRKKHEKAQKTMTGVVEQIQERNVKVWVFPEGTRGRQESMLPFKKGAFNLAVEAQIPIVPVVISSFRPFFNKKNHIFNSGKIIMTCLPPISTKGFTFEDVPELTENTRTMMMEEFDQTKLEVEEYCARLRHVDPPLNGKKTS